jgi:hypothetical protein
VTERADGTANRSGAHRAFARGTYSFARDWDASLAASGLFGRGFGQRRDGLGAEIGRQLGSGVWLAAGWNRFGYEDDELAGEEYTREGCFLRLRARFDEEMFRRAREVRR